MREKIEGSEDGLRNMGKQWGDITELEGHNIYVSSRKPTHFCRKYKGWGLQMSLYDYLKDKAVDRVVIWLPTGYRVSLLADWEKHGVVDTLNPEDGEQIFLRDTLFLKKGSGVLQAHSDSEIIEATKLARRGLSRKQHRIDKYMRS